MHFTPLIFSCLALFGASRGALLAEAEAGTEATAVPAIILPAPPAVQNQIINLQATIVYLTNDIVQSNQANGKKDWNTANQQFKRLARSVITSPDSCPPSQGQGRIVTAQAAIVSLNTTQNNLSQLSLDLANAKSSRALIVNDYCKSYAKFGAVQYYVFNILGTPANGASNRPIAQSLDTASYDPNKLVQTYTASQIALEALINALNNDNTGESPATKTAYRNAQDAIARYRTAANPNSSSQCRAVKLASPRDSPAAIDYTKIVEQTVQRAYSDTTASNGKAFDDFCSIGTYMTGIDAWVQV